ncbi:MAG: restriction endonuclease [Planctomycetes bacterium]|nr:restriction endonuclease [Planctomycetota bacterium]
MSENTFYDMKFESDKERNAYAFRNGHSQDSDDVATNIFIIITMWILVAIIGLIFGAILGAMIGQIVGCWFAFSIMLLGFVFVPIAIIKCGNCQSQIEKFALEHQAFLEEVERNIREDILSPFNKRYLSYEQKIENIENLLNLINHRENLELVDKDIKFILIQNEIETNIDFFDKEVSKLKNKDIVNLSRMLIRLVPDANFEHEVDYFEKEVSKLKNQKDIIASSKVSFNKANFKREDGECKHVLYQFIVFLERKQIPYDLDKLKKTLRSEYKSLKAVEFEEKLRRGHNKKVTVDDIDHLNGFEFEEFIGDMYRKAGYKVTVTKKSGDQGADLIIEKDGVSTAVQTKKYSGSVGNSAVQEVVAAMKYYDCDKSMVITTAKFTKSALELAGRNGVELIDKNGLDVLLDKIL